MMTSSSLFLLFFKRGSGISGVFTQFSGVNDDFSLLLSYREGGISGVFDRFYDVLFRHMITSISDVGKKVVVELCNIARFVTLVHDLGHRHWRVNKICSQKFAAH
jgi:hypothetical protein